MKVGVWEAFLLVLRRELALSFRRPDQLLQPLVFFLIVTTLFPLGLSVQLSLLRDMAPGVLWVAALLSSLLSLDALFKSDADDGTLEQLALSGQGLIVIVMAKTLAHWLVSGAALVLVSPIVGTALAIPEAAFGTMMLSLSLGTLTLSWLGAIGAGLTVGLKRGSVLLSLIVLPLRCGGLVPACGTVRANVHPGAVRGDGGSAYHARVDIEEDLCGHGFTSWPLRPTYSALPQR